MHIFLVNDDGIGSKGIMALARAAVAKGHKVSMCAPAFQQSAASQRISLIEPIYVEPYPVAEEGLAAAYAIKGTPTDCVRLGLLDLIREPVDVLISGINDGYNAGMAVHYSGTVSAAREGSLNRIPSIAASISYRATPEMLEHFAAYVIRVAEEYRSFEISPAMVLNINAPFCQPEALLSPVFVPLSKANYVDSYLRRESPRAGVYYWLESGAQTEPSAEGSDQDMLEKGHITLTCMGNPVEFGTPSHPFAEACQKLSKEI